MYAWWRNGAFFPVTGTQVTWSGVSGGGELARYLAGWDVAMMPFARNDATRFISPTKTLEYLAAVRLST